MRRVLWALGAALLLFVGYEAFAVWRAWQRTPQVVALARTGELKLADVSPLRLQWLLMIEDPSFRSHHGTDWSTPSQGNTNLTQGLTLPWHRPSSARRSAQTRGTFMAKAKLRR